MEFKRISVLIPAYNAEPYIEKAIKSAQSQSRLPDEIIVGNDASTDRTSELARSLGAVVLDLPKGNGSIARNAAAKAATGDIFFFLDADDWWESNKIERHLEQWNSVAASVVLDRSVATTMESDTRWKGGLDMDGYLDWRGFLNHKAWPSGSGFSVPAENYWKVNGFNEKLGKYQDVDFWVRCAEACGPAYQMSAVLTHYLLVQGSVSKRIIDPEANLKTLFDGWPFATAVDKARFRSLAYLIAAGATRWPDALKHLSRAGWPVSRRFFWRCLLVSLKRTVLRSA